MSYHDPIPSYYKIKMSLLGKISSGEWPIGTRIPSELELSELYQTSRPTVRQAIMSLVHEGYLERVRGRGTFVKRPLITKNAEIFSTFAEDMAKEGIPHASLTVSKTTVHATEGLAAELGITEGDRVYEIVRIRIGSGERLVLRMSYIAEAMCPGLIEEDLDAKPLYEIIRRRTNVFPAAAVQKFRAIVASHTEATLLQIPVGSPLLEWKGIVYDSRETPVEKVRALYRGDKFEFTVTQGRRTADVEQIHVGLGILF
ncbi:MAG: GntR family transcriptional regulator [Alicyclobacillus shizuokensis]|nr:GntR family transcriptional regulator [Alicyclobacillus shizuokensis]